MLRFIVRRLVEALPVVFLATVVIFLGLRLLPGDPAQVLAGADATPATLAAIRTANGLDEPLPLQNVIWIRNVVRGDLGVSFFTRAPVSRLLAQRIPATIELGLAGMFVTMPVGIPTGIVAAVQSRRPPDWLISAFNGLAVAVPGFWLGILAILFFSLVLGWLPPGGHGDLFKDPGLESKFLLLPAVTLALPFAAGVSRLVKSSMLEVLGDDSVRTARAKGVGERDVIWRHALRNAMVPVATILGLQFGRLLVIVFVLINLLTDITYGLLDPRIRLTGGKPR